MRTQLYLVRVQAPRASVSPPWISLDYSVSSFIFLKLHAMFLKKFIASTCQSLTRKLFSTPRACRKPDVGVVRTTTNRRPSLLSCFELMSSNLPNNKANQPITLTQSCLKANLPSHCALTHSAHKYKPNKPCSCCSLNTSSFSFNLSTNFLLCFCMILAKFIELRTHLLIFDYY